MNFIFYTTTAFNTTSNCSSYESKQFFVVCNIFYDNIGTEIDHIIEVKNIMYLPPNQQKPINKILDSTSG